jgi:hypothetical protein
MNCAKKRRLLASTQINIWYLNATFGAIAKACVCNRKYPVLQYFPESIQSYCPGASPQIGGEIMKLVVIMASLLSSVAFAQTRMEAFPADSTPLTSAEQHAGLAGKTYTTERFKDGSYWQVAFESNGRFTFYAFPGSWQDSGKLPDGKSEICSDGKVMEVWCNGIQMRGQTLFLKSGKQGVIAMEVVQ